MKSIEIRIDAADDYVRVDTEMPNRHNWSFLRWLFDGGPNEVEVIYWITLPKRASVEVTNTNGSIRSEFPVTIEERGFVGKRLEGQIGEGATRLQLHTTNGSIRLRKLGVAL